MSKSLFTILLAAGALTGCSHLVNAPEAPRETKIYRAPHPTVVPARPETGKPVVDPNYVSHGSGTWTSPSATVPVAKASAEPPAPLEVTDVPSRAFRAYPVFNFRDDVIDAKFSPANALATWEVTSEGKTAIAKVKVDLADDTNEHTGSFEATAAELELPDLLKGAQKLTLPLTNPGFIAFLAKCPDAKKVMLTASLEGPDEKPIVDKKGKPVTLVLPIAVL